MNNEEIAISLAAMEELPSLLRLVEKVKWNFPGLMMDEYKMTAIKNINRESAICAKDGDRVVGILLYSKEKQILSCLAVEPDYRRMSIATRMVNMMFDRMNCDCITVTTFREGDIKGNAPRSFYKKLGFIEGVEYEQFGYPVQQLIYTCISAQT